MKSDYRDYWVKKIGKDKLNAGMDVVLTFAANIIGTLISAVITFVLPKVLGVASYGYYQLFILYSGYVALAHFGTIDGMFLRHGGEYYEQIDKVQFTAFFKAMTLWQLFMGGSLIVFGLVRQENTFIVVCTGVYLILANVQAIFEYIFMATGRIRQYATISVMNKVVYLVLVMTAIFGGLKTWEPLIVMYLFSYVISLMWSTWLGRKLFSRKAFYAHNLLLGFVGIITDIKVGIVLILSNVAGSFIVGYVRLSIEDSWSVEVFSKVSLTLSVSNLLLTMVGAVARVLFPIIKRAGKESAGRIYTKMRAVLMLAMFTMMLLYYPGYIILQLWLPSYSDGLRYMAMLFPVCVFSSKYSMLIETYLKSFRKERWLFMINLTTVLMSIGLSNVTTHVMRNLDLSVLLIVLLLSFRCVVSELLLSTQMNIDIRVDLLIEILISAGFIMANWFIGGFVGFAIYALIYIVYLYIKRTYVKAFILLAVQKS